MRLSGKKELSKSGVSRLETNLGTAFILAIVINGKVAKTEASFWLLGLQILGGVILFLVTVLVSYLAQVFLGLICVAAPTATVRGIDNIDFRSWSRAFSFLF